MDILTVDLIPGRPDPEDKNRKKSQFLLFGIEIMHKFAYKMYNNTK